MTWSIIAFLLLVVVVWNNHRVQKQRRARQQRRFKNGLQGKKSTKNKTS